jgi:DNA polymerase III epsilon subunit-like protein
VSKERVPAIEARLIALDFESTGKVPGYPEQPWQIGLVPVDGGRVCFDQAYVSWLKIPVDRPFNPLAPGSWRFVREELTSAPGLADLIPDLRGRLLGLPLIAHNAATEKKMLREAWPLHRPGPWIDTLKLARMAYPGLPNYRLETVVEAAGVADDLRLNLPDRAAHDALFDAAACGLVLCAMLKLDGWGKLTVEDLTRAKG